MKIKLLDPSVANKIAAGEVVERPASIVKELTENCLDAGATGITVEIRGGGIDLIRVTDNGCGMAQEDVKNAFLRHATSKIEVSEDLNDIVTLGFRGEALASIAAVSHVQAMTRTSGGDAGTEICLSGGVIEKFCDCGCPEGTDIRVADLFYNTPARRKFLKKPSQEASYIGDVINRLALSHPAVSFRYISDGKTVLRTPGDGQQLSCIRAIYGSSVSEHMIPLSFSKGVMTLSGYIGDREIQKSNRGWQILFINGRSVKNDRIAAAVQQGYAGRLNVGKFPFFVINLSLPGTLVDVNVHPTKQEVRFADGLPIFETFAQAIKEALLIHQEIPTLFPQPQKAEQSDALIEQINRIEPKQAAPAPIAAPLRPEATTAPFVKRPATVIQVADFGEVPQKERKTAITFGGETRRMPVAPPVPQSAEGKPAPKPAEPEQPSFVPPAEPAKGPEPVQESLPLREEKTVWETVGVLFDTYILVQAGDEAYMIDQHAAHERLLFEKYFAAEQTKGSQLMLVPQTFHVAPGEQVFLEELLPALAEIGFEIESMGFSAFAVKATPLSMEGEDVLRFVTGLLDEKNSLRALKGNELKRDKLIQMACKHAVKGGDKLSREEIDSLMERIQTEGIPLSCPHGRPIMVRLTKHELEVRFKRIQ